MKRQKHHGFTLIELVVASAIAVVLMGAVLAMLASIARDRVRLATARPAEAADQSSLVELFRRDLLSATKIQVNQSNHIVLETCASLDGQTWQRIDRPSIVTYRLIEDHGFHWLVRQQRFADDPISPMPNRGLVAFDARLLELRPLADNQNGTAHLFLAAPQPRDLTRRFHLRVVFENPRTNIDQVVCLR